MTPSSTGWPDRWRSNSTVPEWGTTTVTSSGSRPLCTTRRRTSPPGHSPEYVHALRVRDDGPGRRRHELDHGVGQGDGVPGGRPRDASRQGRSGGGLRSGPGRGEGHV